MSSRIERVLREVSDLRSFYLTLQKTRRQTPPPSKENKVEEAAQSYESKSTKHPPNDPTTADISRKTKDQLQED